MGPSFIAFNGGSSFQMLHPPAQFRAAGQFWRLGRRRIKLLAGRARMQIAIQVRCWLNSAAITGITRKGTSCFRNSSRQTSHSEATPMNKEWRLSSSANLPISTMNVDNKIIFSMWKSAVRLVEQLKRRYTANWHSLSEAHTHCLDESFGFRETGVWLKWVSTYVGILIATWKWVSVTHRLLHPEKVILEEFKNTMI